MLRVGRKEHEYFQLAALGFVQMRVGGNPRGHEKLRSRVEAHPVHPPAAPPYQRTIRTSFNTLKPGPYHQPFAAEFAQPGRKDPLCPAAARELTAHWFLPQITACPQPGITGGLEVHKRQGLINRC